MGKPIRPTALPPPPRIRQIPSADNPNSAIIISIDSGISMIKGGDNDGAKKALYQAEASLEDQPNQSGAEKHIEASLMALKDGDTSGALTHAAEAKKGLA